MLLSVLLPGLGQVHVRSWRVGVAFLAANILIGAALKGLTEIMPPSPRAIAWVAGLLVIDVALSIFIFADAVRRARQPSSPVRPRWFRSTWFTAIAALAIGAVVSETLPFGWQTFWIPSASMLPTLQVGDYILVDASGAPPARGDVVVFKYPPDPTIDYVKRLVGLPGDHVQLRHGTLFINGGEVARLAGQPLDGGATRYTEALPDGRHYEVQKMTDTGALNDTIDFVVPPAKFFVLGDNRDDSADSRMADQVGFVPMQNLVGRATLITYSGDPARILTPIE